MIDITNQRFGRLIVLYKSDKRGADGGLFWHCKCDCGNECDINSYNLRKGFTKSCGCLRKEMGIEAIKNINTKNGKDISGQKFGKLTAIKPLEERNKRGGIQWYCECECGNHKIVETSELISGNIVSCGCMRQSHGEFKIEEILKQNNIPYIKEYQVNVGYKSGRPARFDFYINNKYFIEFDGKQHFQEVNYFSSSLEENQEKDKIKNNWCKENNIPLIRIPYTELKDLSLEDLLLETSKYKII